LYLSAVLTGPTGELATILTVDVKHNCGDPQQLHGKTSATFATLVNDGRKIEEFPPLTPR
jgi:hypothetical protein